MSNRHFQLFFKKQAKISSLTKREKSRSYEWENFMLEEKAMKKLLTLVESAPLLKISETTLRRLIKSRKIPYRKIGRRYYLSHCDINYFLERSYYPMKEENYDTKDNS